MSEEKREYEEAKLYLKHTGIDDFKWATEKILKLVDKQEKELKVTRQMNSNLIEVLKESISKDKIREKIKEVSNGTYDAKIILEQLLEK